MAKKENIPGEVPPVENTVNTDNAKVETNENIVTYEELEKKKETKKEKKKEIKKDVKKNVQFECSFAPMGDAKTVISYKLGDKTITKELVLHNKIYEFPKDLNDEESKILRKALVNNGFVDVSVFESAKYEKEKKQYVYSAMHPDHSNQDPINANISLPICDNEGKKMYGPDGNQIFRQVAVLNGLVKTDDKSIYQALIKAGFKSCFAQEKVR